MLWERGSSSADWMFFLSSPLPRVMHLPLTSSAPRPVSMSVIDKWLMVQKVRGVGLGLPASRRSAVEYFIGTQMCCCLYNCPWLLSLALLELHEFSLYSRPSVELHLYSQPSFWFNTFATSVCNIYALQLSSMLVYNASSPFLTKWQAMHMLIYYPTCLFLALKVSTTDFFFFCATLPSPVYDLRVIRQQGQSVWRGKGTLLMKDLLL